MIKQKLYPLFATYDIINSEMPAVFLDPRAKVKIYLYKTNQNFNELFIDENISEQRVINYSLEEVLEVWISQNLTKQINPFQDSSASKTIAMQSEIELYFLKNIEAKIKETFYFFTFSPMNQEDKVQKFLIKEVVQNIDKNKYRFSKIKAWQLSSILFKQYQYWNFNESINLNRQKIKRIKIEVPSYSGIGNIRCIGNYTINQNPQNIPYKLTNIIHPFDSLELIATNFSFQNNNLTTQFVIWDELGQSIKQLKNNYFVLEGGTNKYHTIAFSKDTLGLDNCLAGATHYPLPAGTTKGLGDVYIVDRKNREATNDLKQYLWTIDNWGSGTIRHYYKMNKKSITSSLKNIEQFLQNSNPTIDCNFVWDGYNNGQIGPSFFDASFPILNDDNFVVSNKLATDLTNIKDYCWILMGRMNIYNNGVFLKRLNGRQSWTDSTYFSFGTLPWGFLNVDKIINMWNNLKIDKNLESIIFDINFENPVYLNSIELNIIYGDKIKLTLFDNNDLITNYEQYTNFYLINQDQIKTKITFF